MQQAIQQFVEFEELVARGSETPEQARRLVQISGRFDNPYQHLLAKWRIGRAETQADSISQHHFELDVSPPEVYLLRILTAVLEELGAQDEYLVVTTGNFWHNASGADSIRSRGSKSATDYLDAQIDAISRGMRLYRVILLDGKNDSEDLVLHEKFFRDVRTKFPEYANNVQVNTRDVKDLKSPSRPFACVRRRSTPGAGVPAEGPDEGCLIVEPHYSPADTISDLRFVFSNGPSHDDVRVRDYVERFLAAMDGSVSVESGLPEPR